MLVDNAKLKEEQAAAFENKIILAQLDQLKAEKYGIEQELASEREKAAGLTAKFAGYLENIS